MYIKNDPVTLVQRNGECYKNYQDSMIDKVLHVLNKSLGDVNYFIDKKYELIGNITIHTYEITKKVSMLMFSKIYNKLRAFIYDRSLHDSYFDQLKESYPANFLKPYSKPTDTSKSSGRKRYRLIDSTNRFRFFPSINIAYGIRMRLSYFNNIGMIKLIINPALLVAASEPDFNPDTYDYTQIAKRDPEFWERVDELIDQFSNSWGITKAGDRWSLTRVDITANIRIGNHISIPRMIHYYKRSIKRDSYKNVKFPSRSMNNHIFECKNTAQHFTIYDKTYEQYIRYNRSHSYKIMRLEYKMQVKRLFTLREFLKRSNILPYQPDMATTLSVLASIAPVIMYSAICNIFKPGDIYSIKAIDKKLKRDTKCKPSTKRRISMFIDLLSDTLDDDIPKIISKYKNTFGIYRYNYIMRYLSEKGISPIALKRWDNTAPSKIPGIKSLFLASIINGYNSGLSDEFDYIRSFLPDLPDQ